MRPSSEMPPSFPSPVRKFVGVCLAVCLVLAAPGLEPYRALAQPTAEGPAGSAPTGPTPWGAFLLTPGAAPNPEFSQALQSMDINISLGLVAVGFIKTMNQTPLQPSALQGKPAQEQVLMIRKAVGDHAASLIEQSAAMLKDPRDVDGTIRVRNALSDLAFLWGAVPEEAKPQVMKSEERLGKTLLGHSGSVIEWNLHWVKKQMEKSSVDYDGLSPAPALPTSGVPKLGAPNGILPQGSLNLSTKDQIRNDNKWLKKIFPKAWALQKPPAGAEKTQHAISLHNASPAGLETLSHKNKEQGYAILGNVSKFFPNLSLFAQEKAADIAALKNMSGLYGASSILPKGQKTSGGLSLSLLRYLKLRWDKSPLKPLSVAAGLATVTVKFALMWSFPVSIIGLMLTSVIAEYVSESDMKFQYTYIEGAAEIIIGLLAIPAHFLFAIIIGLLHVDGILDMRLTWPAWLTGISDRLMAFAIRHRLPLLHRWAARRLTAIVREKMSLSGYSICLPYLRRCYPSPDRSDGGSLMLALRSPYPELSQLAAEILAANHFEIPLLLFKEALADPRTYVRANTLTVVGPRFRSGSLGIEDMLAVLIDAAKDPEVSVRRSVTLHLAIAIWAEPQAHRGDSEAAISSALLAASKEPDFQVRVQAATALIMNSPRYLKKLDGKQLQDMVRDMAAYLENGDPLFKEKVVHALHNLPLSPYAIEAVAKWLKQLPPDSPARNTAVYLLGRQGSLPESALKDLLATLTPKDISNAMRGIVFAALFHENPEIRELASKKLGKEPITDKKDLDVIAKALTYHLAHVRRGALVALENTKDIPVKIAQSLAKLLQDGNPEVRDMAAWLLAQADAEAYSPEVLERLQTALKDPEAAVRIWAAGALLKSGDTSELIVQELASHLLGLDQILHGRVFQILHALPTLPDPIVDILAQTLKNDPSGQASSEDKQLLAVGLLAESSKPSEKQLLVLAQTLDSPSRLIADAAHDALIKHDALPKKVVSVLLDYVLQGSLLTADVLWHLKTWPDPVKNSLLHALRAANGSSLHAKHQKYFLIRLLERRVQAVELLAVLYPQLLPEILELVPHLAELPAQGLISSDFVFEDSLRMLIADLKALRQDLGTEEYSGLVRNFKSLREFRTARQILLRRPEAENVALGYRLPYPVPGLRTEPSKLSALWATVDSGGASDKTAVLKSFEAFDAFIDANNKVLRMIAEHASSLDKKTALSILAQVERMIELLRLIDGQDRSKETGHLQELRAELETLWLGIPEAAALPEEIARRLTELESGEPELAAIRNVNTFINYLHLKSFNALSRAAQEAKADGFIDIGENKISLLNLSDQPLTRKRRLSHPLLKLIAVEDAPKAQAIFRDDQLWLHAQLGSHSAEIQAKLAEPDEGGYLRVNYMEGGNDKGNQLRLVYVREVLRLLGCPSEIVGNRYLNAAWDKDHGLVSKAQIEAALPRLLHALSFTGNLDWGLQAVQLAHGFGEGEKVAKAMAAAYIAEGQVPYFVRASGSSDLRLYDRYRKYERASSRKARAGLFLTLNRELGRLDLPEIPEDIVFGQETIRERFTLPVRLAAARGELRFDKGGIPQRAPYRPVADLAASVRRDEEGALRLAEALAALEPGQAKWEPIGAVGRLKAERAQWLWEEGGGVSVVALRDDSGAVAYAQAQSWDGKALRELDAAGLAEAFDSHGLARSPGYPPGRLRRERWKRLLALPPAPAESRPQAPGLAASAGRGGFATGPVVFRRDGPIKPGSIFIAPYTTPDDLKIMRLCEGVVTTGGGALSHAAITTRELGLPAVILSNARWTERFGQPALELTLERPKDAVRDAGGLWVSQGMERHALVVREGDLVRVDGLNGLVTNLSAEYDGSAMVEASARSDIQRIHRELRELAAGRGNPATLGPFPGPAGAAALRFAVEEVLWNQSLSRFRPLLPGFLAELAPEQRRELESWGQGLLASRAAAAEQEAAAGREASEGDMEKLKAELAELSGLAETLKLDRAPLQALERRLADWQSLSAEFNRRAAALAAAAWRVWHSRLKDWKPAHLPSLRWLLRKSRGSEAASLEELAALQENIDALARRKKERLLSSKPAVLGLDEVDDDFAELVGGKASKLGQIRRVVEREGGRVPGGVALTTEAYLRYLRESGLAEQVLREARELDAYLSKAGLNEESTAAFIRERSSRIRALIRSSKLDAEKGLGKELAEALKARSPGGALFAVRSSAVQEDREEAAFAGAAETYLYVELSDVLDKVVEDWASFWLPRGIEYRWQRGIRSEDLKPAVVIQEMAEANSAGVMFTVNPMNGRREILVNAAYGLGEGIVSGLVEADQYVAGRDGEELASPVLGDKKVKVARKAEGKGTEVQAVPRRERRARTLSPEQVRELARMGAALEEYFGYPLDVEFAIEEGEVAILQARPVTTNAASAQRKDAQAPKPADFSALMSFYLVQALYGQGNARVTEEALLAWSNAAKRYLVAQSLEASVERIHRISDRIANLNPDPKVRGGEREWIVDPQTKRRVKLIDSTVMSHHAWLKQSLFRAAKSKTEAGRAIASAANLLKFYRELSSSDMASAYPRGATNNKPWMEIAEALVELEQARDAAALRHAIDALRNKVHNTGQSFLEYAPDAQRLLGFFDLTRQSKNGEDIAFALRFADPEIASLFRAAAPASSRNHPSAHKPIGM